MIKKEQEKKVVELTLDDLENNGVVAVSLVDEPAIEFDYMLFNKEKINVTLAQVDEEQRIITGPALIPDKEIYRFNQRTNEEFYVWFSKETVKKVSEKFLIDQNNSNVTLDHQNLVSNISVIESWIVTDPENDKAKALGYDVPEGTWMLSMKVNNDMVWTDLIKSGLLRGFSIEGSFSHNFEKMSKNEEIHEIIDELTEDDRLELVEELLNDYVEIDDDDESLDEDEIELAEKPKFYAKKWITVQSSVGPCPFCTPMNGIKVRFGSTWTHPTETKYTQLLPKKVHKGCRCEWERVEVRRKEYRRLK